MNQKKPVQMKKNMAPLRYDRRKSESLSVMTYLLLITTFLVNVGCSVDDKQSVVNFTELTFQEEFDTDGAPSTATWNYNIGSGVDGWGNQELQYYTDRPENITVNNGVLIITAEKEDFNGAGYTSARITTKDIFEQEYGRFEARIRTPFGQGLWPAFWMLGANSDEVVWPACGEIDIMEIRGQNPSIVVGSVHGPGYSAGESISKSYDLVNDRFDTGFHVFGIEWGPKYINYYVDDVLYSQLTPEDVTGEWIFDDQPFYIILNVAVGGTFPGAPNADTRFPQTMLVDYVRAYK